jgi:hypothetical protein
LEVWISGLDLLEQAQALCLSVKDQIPIIDRLNEIE